MAQKAYTKSQKAFAEKCRIALEKSWGEKVPMPKYGQRSE
jgi:hypothetical protein